MREGLEARDRAGGGKGTAKGALHWSGDGPIWRSTAVGRNRPAYILRRPLKFFVPDLLFVSEVFLRSFVRRFSNVDRRKVERTKLKRHYRARERFGIGQFHPQSPIGANLYHRCI